uniref:WH2 domain-containing protein n=1 Tax=Globodera pallida TaxID=36090 RepID=A0A183CAW3_GLOPA
MIQKQWFPQQTASWVPWQQQQQQQVVQQPWVNNNNHHHHHVDHDHHPPPVHHEEDDHHHPHHHHHHFQQHYPPIRNGNNDNQQQQQAVIPYWQEQFSPLGADLAAASSSSPEFQEELPELYKPPIIQHVQAVGQHPQQQQQQNIDSRRPPNGSGGGNVNNAIFTHQQRQQQEQCLQHNQQELGPPAQRAALNNILRRIIPAVRLPPNTAVAGNSNENKFGTNGNVQQRKFLLLTTAVPTASAKFVTRRPAPQAPPPPPPLPAVPKHPQQAVPAKQPSPTIAKEFDLPPPPPPSRFLPDVEKARIAEQLRHKGLSTPREGVASDAIPSEEPAKVGTLLSTTVPTISTETAATTARPTTPSPAPARLSATATATTSSQKTPNESFLHCCRVKRVPKICESRCNFEVLNKKTLTALFLNTDKCPSEYGK